MPYVYLIGWSHCNIYYYGVRYSKHANPEDLWVSYKTSSVYVAKYVEQHGNPDIISIRKIFEGNYEDSKERALSWESKVLKRMNAVNRPDFLNRWDNNMVPMNLDGPFPFESHDIQHKVDNTLKTKYNGRGSASEEIKQRVFATNMSKYGTRSTTGLEHVQEARIAASLKKFGTENPFENPDKMKEVMLQKHGVTNMMLDPSVKEKHKKKMESIDWTERNEKVRQTNLSKYGMVNPLNRPEIREKHKRACPFGCKDNHRYDAGNFTNHMKKVHSWTKEQIESFKNENKKD